MKFSAKEIAKIVEGVIEGNSDVEVNSFAKIEEGQSHTLSFLANPKYYPHIYTTKSSIVLVNHDFSIEKPVNCTLIRVKDAYTSFAKLLNIYQSMRIIKQGISSKASISESSSIGKDVYIGDFVVIGDGAIIGNNVQIFPNSYIGDNVRIGDNTVLNPGVIIYSDCEIGAKCTIHGGVVIGADGFGFAPQSDNNYQKIAQIGNVIIEDNVEIGANTTIDRATMGSTIIRKGVKLDNLIQVAHNVEIGYNTVIAAQTGIAGSTKIGNNCMIGGQVGFAGHMIVADDVKIGAQSGLSGDITKPGSIVIGSPAIDAGRFRRIIAIFNNLDKLYYRVWDIEKELNNKKK